MLDLWYALSFSHGSVPAALLAAAKSVLQPPPPDQSPLSSRMLHPPPWWTAPRPLHPGALHCGLGLFVAASDFQIRDAFNSACIFLQQFTDAGWHVKSKFRTKNRVQQRFDFFRHQRFELPGNWAYSILALGPWFSQFDSEGGNQNFYDGKNTVMASLSSKSSVSSGGGPTNKRFWTNSLIILNVLMFVAQELSGGRLLLWGAKVNSLIDQGQLWRLITPAMLHANLGHLLVNCYSLHSVGPAVEALAGPKRFLAVYTASAVSGLAMSYLFSKAPAVGASGAIFGLVGSMAVFLVRHKNFLSGGQQSLAQIARVITINFVLGLVSENIDNFGHLGGLLGGALVSWLLGPALSFKSPPGGGREILVDEPPIYYMLPKGKRLNP